VRRQTMIWTAVLALASLGFAGAANAQVDTQPPGAARISFIHGDVSMQRGDSGETSAVDLNTPLAPGDKVFTGADSRAEIQLDWADILRLDQNAQANIATLEQNRIQVQLSQGLAFFSVLKGSQAQVEIDTPNVAVTPHQEGRYRIEVTPDGDTLVTVREGTADVSTADGSTPLKQGDLITVRGTGSDAQYQITQAAAPDEFDKWNSDRDQTIANAESYHYTNQYYTGAADLDTYGQWSQIPDYGYVWYPHVAVGWAPYRHGRWLWEPYWGWTWVGAESWGWAPYHYGRWFVYGGSWVWWPGPVTPIYRPLWAPAYVSFFGFGPHIGFGLGFGSIGWLPVGPCDYVNPWWGPHRGAFSVVSVANIGTFRNANMIAPLRGGDRYSNLHNMLVSNQVRYGLSTVSAENFGHIGAHVSTITAANLRQGQMMTGNVPVVPSRETLRASDRPAGNIPSARAGQVRFFSKRLPSTQRESFSQQSAQVQQAIQRDSRVAASSNASRQQNFGNRTANGGNVAARNGNAGINSARQPAAQAQTPALQSRRELAPGWNRFGSGQGASGSASGNAAVANRGQSSTPNTAATRRFEMQGSGNQRANAGPSPAEPQNGWRRFSGGNQANPQSFRSESRPPLELNQPIIRQRSYGGSVGAAPGFSQRATPAPRSMPAPEPSYGGNHGAVQSAPRSGGYGGGAPRSGGGGGGGHATGGGHSRGGGGHGGGGGHR
jgi:Family of unknown function (DUF6600)/FecR protein